MESTQKPVLKALLVADHVYKDSTSGKIIVCGIFHNIFLRRTSEQPPAFTEVQNGFAAGSPFAYVAVTEAKGSHTLNLRYVNLATDLVYFQVELKVECKDPLLTIDIPVPLPVLPMEKGVYALELLWNSNDPMGSFRITVGDVNDNTIH